jgi:hypothetical protein
MRRRDANNRRDAPLIGTSAPRATDSLGISLNHTSQAHTMRTQSLQPAHASSPHAAAHAAAIGAIPWEDTPSMADTLSLRLLTQGGLRFVDLDLGAANSETGGLDSGYRQPVTWDNTMPAALDPVLPAEPFREAFQGLSMREVREPDVFRHFFG